MELFDLTIDMFKSYILVLIRVSVVLFMLPIFGGKKIATIIKAGCAFSISLVLLPVVHPDPALFPDNPWFAFMILCSEIILGFLLGFIIDCFFSGIQLAGQMIGMQMGMAIATVVDPNSGIQSSMVSQLGFWVAVITFVVLNGHILLLFAIKESFSIIPIGSLSLQAGLYKPVLQMASDIFTIAVQIGAPAIAALLFTDVAFALTAKVSPQMNVFIVALPLKIAIGLFFFGLTLNMVLYFMRNYLNDFLHMMKNLMSLMV